MRKAKMDGDLIKLLDENPYEQLSVIVQTEDGLTDDDKSLVKRLGGTVKDNLYIINAFSADIPAEGLKKMILSPRVLKVFNDGKVRSI